MNLDQIETKCFILALFVRDDGERFLLGSRMFEFVDSQLHFAANAYQNDIVEVQGNDGIMLAGQVRRSSSQAFDGYIGDSSVDKATIEQNRRDFFKFFRKNHYYKVVYILPNGSAIQRRQGFIVEAPEVRELYQLFPKYHISMNFEDINYYNYEEDSEGEEIYGESATLKVATSATGGLIWENGEETPLSGEGTNFTVNGTIDGNPLTSVELRGDTTQQTYSGKNLFAMPNSQTVNHVTMTVHDDGTFDLTGTASATGNFYVVKPLAGSQLVGGNTYTIHIPQNMQWTLPIFVQSSQSDGTFSKQLIAGGLQTGTSKTVVLENPDTQYVKFLIQVTSGSTYNLQNFYVQLESGSSPTSYEPYVGGIASPNPDYPQTVNTVTGRQVVTIAGGDSQSQSYEINLGKNLFDKDNSNISHFYPTSSGFSQSSAAVVIVIPVESGQSYTVSSTNRSIIDSSASIAYTDKIITSTSDTYINRSVWGSSNDSISTTAPNNAKYMYLYVAWTTDDTTISNILATIQIEKGSTATTFAPYFTPIELCKIGTYQDYIYKDNGDWYIHKETKKIDMSSIADWGGNGNGQFYKVGFVGAYGIKNDVLLSNIFTYSNTTWAGVGKFGITSSNNLWCQVVSTMTDASAFPAWLANHFANLYGILTTATDMQITNADLVSQLEALLGGTTYDGVTIFNVDGQLQAILSVDLMAIDGGGVVWDEYGATWEEGTGGGPTMIDIESIDNVYPVWELTGPAVNPQISVLTTNTTLSYTGSITSSQTLRVDMFNKTATLNGTSVVGNISGDWVYLKPGINRVTYTTTNADAAESTIWWQEIVG